MWPKPAGLSRGATSSAWCGRAQPTPPDGAAAVGWRAHWARRCARVRLFLCLQFRATLHNERSNRSHTILQLRIERPARPSGSPSPAVPPPVPFGSRCPPTPSGCPAASCAPVSLSRTAPRADHPHAAARGNKRLLLRTTSKLSLVDLAGSERWLPAARTSGGRGELEIGDGHKSDKVWGAKSTSVLLIHDTRG